MIDERQAIAELLLNIENQSIGDFMEKMSFLLDCWWIMDEVAVDICSLNHGIQHVKSGGKK